MDRRPPSPRSQAERLIERFLAELQERDVLVSGRQCAGLIVEIYRLLCNGEMPQVSGLDVVCGPPSEQPAALYEPPARPDLNPVNPEDTAVTDPVIDVEFEREEN